MRLFIPIILVFVLTACGSNLSKPTLYPFINQTSDSTIKTVMIADVNLGVPSRHYLKDYEPLIDNALKSYLEKNHYQVISNKAFTQQWQLTQQQYGALFDPSTGKNTFAKVLALKSSLQSLFARYKRLDVIIFTDLIETPVNYQFAAQSYAEFNGVRERIPIKGDELRDLQNAQLPTTVNSVSLAVSIFNRQQQLIFHSVGGIELSEALEIKNGQAQFVRRNNLFDNTKLVQQAIQLALHPFIVMKNYPTK